MNFLTQFSVYLSGVALGIAFGGRASKTRTIAWLSVLLVAVVFGLLGR